MSRAYAFCAMAHLAAFQSLSFASCRFIGHQPRWSSTLVSLKVSALPLRIHIHHARVMIRCHLKDLSPKELDQIRKKEALKKLRKIRKERRAKRLAEELAKTPQVKPNPAMRKFERPLLNWNKPWKKREVLVKKKEIGGRHQGLGFEQGERWFRNSTAETSSITRREANSEVPESLWREFEAVYEETMRKNNVDDGKHSVVNNVGVDDVDVSEFQDNRDMAAKERSGESTKVTREREFAKKGSRTQVPRIVIGQRKGENVYLSIGDDDAAVKRQIPRSELDEEKQLEWLAKQLDSNARPDGVHLSRIIRSGGLKLSDDRSIILVQRLGELGNWRCALQVVEWLNSRNHFPAVKSKYLYTSLLVVLGKARRPIESLSVFNAMKEHVASYPDMPAYHIVAVTLGQAGYLEELLELMQILRQGPKENGKFLLFVDKGRLTPDIVVYNAALNACVSHKHWRLALWILDEIQREKNVWANSASYGLAIEVMVKAGKFDLAWKILKKMDGEGFHPNSLTYKALVEGLGQIGQADLAVQMVKQMEERGIVAVPGVYYALASTLCTCGKWQDALLQVDRIASLSGRPVVETYTGLIKACKESGRWRDAMSVFEHMREVCAPNIGTYNIMISIYAQKKLYDEAKNLFDLIKKGRISPPQLYRGDVRLSPDVFTYEAMLGACVTSEKWEDLEVLFRQMLLQGYQLNSKRHAWILQAISEAGKDGLVAAMFSHLKSLKAATPEVYGLMIKSCLRGGEHDKAFSHLEEMVNLKMRISRSDLQEFQRVASLLSEEDRLNFKNKVESLKSISDFNFSKDINRLSNLYQRSSAFKEPKKRHSLLNIPYGNREEINISESSHSRLQGISRSLLLQERSLDTALSPVDLVLKNAWSSEGVKDDSGKPHRQRDDLQSILMSSNVPGWELLWKRSSHRQRNSKNFRLVEQLT